MDISYDVNRHLVRHMKKWHRKDKLRLFALNCTNIITVCSCGNQILETTPWSVKDVPLCFLL